MALFSNDTSYIITRNEAVERWCRVNPDGSHEILDYHSSKKAGNVARQVAATNPNHQIGILSEVFGPRVKIVYGEIVWLKQGFND